MSSCAFVICVLLCAKASAEEAAASSPRSFMGLAGILACPFRYFPTTGAEFHVLVAELLSLEASLGAQPGAGLFVDEILEICPSVCWTRSFYGCSAGSHTTHKMQLYSLLTCCRKLWLWPLYNSRRLWPLRPSGGLRLRILWLVGLGPRVFKVLI